MISVQDNGSGKNVYVIDGVLQKTITLQYDTEYKFTFPQGHPLKFRGKESQTEITSIISENTNTSLKIQFPSETPTVEYYCGLHTGMGGDIVFDTINLGSVGDTTSNQPQAIFSYNGNEGAPIATSIGKELLLQSTGNTEYVCNGIYIKDANDNETNLCCSTHDASGCTDKNDICHHRDK